MKRIGLLTGGGDCPGLNAVIRSVTKSLLSAGGIEVLGIEDGFAGLVEGRMRPLVWRDVSGILAWGGTILGTSNRCNPLDRPEWMNAALQNAHAWGLDALLTVGGDGTQSIAHGLSEQGLPAVGVPKTIDNDIATCERSFGFDTAVATITEALERVQTSGQSHSRIMIVETMGRNAGWLPLEAGLAAAADIILLPEIDYDLEVIASVCRERAAREKFTLICMGEGAKARGASQTVAYTVAGSHGQRLGGVAQVLRESLEPLVQSEVRATVLGHIQRGGRPTAFDRVLATRMGHLAAQCVLAGQFNRCVSYQAGVLSTVPLQSVANQQRTVPLDHPLLQMAREIGVSLGVAEIGA